MDRNNRYPRRGCYENRRPEGYPPMKPWQGARGMQNTKPSENCLCDGQPISLAMAYVKIQPFGNLYEPCEGWKNGTLFADLNMPYCIGGKRR